VRRLTIAAAVLAGAVAACGDDDPSVVSEQAGKPVVVTALRPLAEAAEEVGGSSIVVVDLTPVGESSHELELTDRSRGEVLDADLAIVLGKGFQPAFERAAARRDGPTLDVLAQLALPDRPDGTDGPVDPHVWLDPTIMGSIVTAIGEAVADVVPDAAEDVRARAASLVEEHVELDAQLRQQLATCTRSVLATQHESFGWFAARYGLRTAGFDAPLPDDDPAPDPARVAAIEPLIEDGEVTTLFVETLSPTSWLEVIAEERGLDVEVLSAYEGLTLREDADGVTYRSVLLGALRAVEDGLDCREASDD